MSLLKRIRDNIVPLGISFVLLAMATTAVVYAPTLYRIFCQATGFGGSVTVKRDIHPGVDRIGREITVRFDANVADGLPWTFKPAQREVKTHIGLPTKIYYTATNNSDHTIVGRAVYNVTPDAAGYYFTKTQCFCFNEQKLAPGETAKMPVMFYVDPGFETDIDTKSIQTITLSYTFFQIKQDKATLAKATSLKEEGAERDKELSTSKTAEFEKPRPLRK
jgi:cytochrome c oxidase assembly protein subunit 11